MQIANQNCSRISDPIKTSNVYNIRFVVKTIKEDTPLPY